MYCNIPTEAFQEFLLVNTTHHQCLFVLDKKSAEEPSNWESTSAGFVYRVLVFSVVFFTAARFLRFLQGSYHLSRQSGIGLQSRIFPSMEMVTTCHGMNFPLVCSAFFAAISKPPQQGTSMRRMVTLWMSLLRRISVSFSL